MNNIQLGIITRAERERWLHLVANDQLKERTAQEKKRSRKAWRAWIVVGAGASIGFVIGLLVRIWI